MLFQVANRSMIEGHTAQLGDIQGDNVIRHRRFGSSRGI